MDISSCNEKKTGIGLFQYQSLTPMYPFWGGDDKGGEYLSLADQNGPGTVIELLL